MGGTVAEVQVAASSKGVSATIGLEYVSTIVRESCHSELEDRADGSIHHFNTAVFCWQAALHASK